MAASRRRALERVIARGEYTTVSPAVVDPIPAWTKEDEDNLERRVQAVFAAEPDPPPDVPHFLWAGQPTWVLLDSLSQRIEVDIEPLMLGTVPIGSWIRIGPTRYRLLEARGRMVVRDPGAAPPP